MATTKHFTLDEDATITADGNSTNEPGATGATKASLYVNATLGGTSPSLGVQLQTKDSLGNWHDVGSAVTLTATGQGDQLDIAGPFGTHFRAKYDVDVANADETYTGVDVSVALQF